MREERGEREGQIEIAIKTVVSFVHENRDGRRKKDSIDSLVNRIENERARVKARVQIKLDTTNRLQCFK